jgi:asparagine synthase (glutamine-hydrolysing)
MCGIYLNLDKNESSQSLWTLFMKSRYRGPEMSSFFTKQIFLRDELPVHCDYGFHHLRINDTSELSNQPFIDSDGSFCICNGEIYNYQSLQQQYLPEYTFRSQSNCEIILPLFKKLGASFINQLDGEFSIIIYSAVDQSFFIARDPIGTRPLYVACSDTQFQVASELKSINLTNVRHFPPGNYLILSSISSRLEFQEYFELCPKNRHLISFEKAAEGLRHILEKAVKKRLAAQVPVGVLLSGGVDSSGIAALASRHTTSRIHTFTIMIEGLPNEDAKCARVVADHIGSIHHEIKVSLQEIFSKIDDLIYIIETYNLEVIPNHILVYLVGKYVRENTSVKVLLDGTGPDEALGGYWFFHDASSELEFEEETIKQLKDIHKTELLSDRALAHFGLESRYPYLDKELVRYLLDLPADYKSLLSKHTNGKKIEKFILRKALEGLLPSNIQFRKKLGMTHGAGENFEYLFDQEIKRRLGIEDKKEDALSHARILGLETYYKQVFFNFFPFAQTVECSVSPSDWRKDDPLSIWR